MWGHAFCFIIRSDHMARSLEDEQVKRQIGANPKKGTTQSGSGVQYHLYGRIASGGSDAGRREGVHVRKSARELTGNEKRGKSPQLPGMLDVNSHRRSFEHSKRAKEEGLDHFPSQKKEIVQE